MKPHKEMLVYLFSSLQRMCPVILQCSLFIYILNTGLGSLYAPRPQWPINHLLALCYTPHQFLSLIILCNYDRSSPFRVSQLYSSLPSCYLFLKAFFLLQCVNRDDEVALFSCASWASFLAGMQLLTSQRCYLRQEHPPGLQWKVCNCRQEKRDRSTFL